MPPLPPFWSRVRQPLVLAAAASFLLGCESSRGVFRAENLFANETQAIAGVFDPSKRVEKPAKKGRRSGRAAGTGELEPGADPYFGRGEVRAGREPRNAKADSKKDRTESSGLRLFGPKESPTGRAEPPAEIATATAPAQNVPPPPAPGTGTGAVCYYCNGKGRVLAASIKDGEFHTCEACGGSGRR